MLIRFNKADVYFLSQKEVVQLFRQEADNVIELEVKTVSVLFGGGVRHPSLHGAQLSRQHRRMNVASLSSSSIPSSKSRNCCSCDSSSRTM